MLAGLVLRCRSASASHLGVGVGVVVVVVVVRQSDCGGSVWPGGVVWCGVVVGTSASRRPPPPYDGSK